MRWIIRFLRHIREINSASFPFIVTGAIILALASLFARVRVHDVFGENIWRLWVFFIVSAGVEVVWRVMRKLSNGHTEITSSFRVLHLTSVSMRDNAIAIVRIVFRILYAIIVAVLHTLQAVFIASKALMRFFLRVSPHALPFALVVLLAEFTPALPTALRMSANILVAYMVICIAMGTVVAAQFSRK